MRKNICFFIKKLDRETGVMVSVKHLKSNLDRVGFPTDICYYTDDSDLIEQVRNSDCKCINLHVPSFSDDTLHTLLGMHDNIVLSIHSTICNLQTEGDAFTRLLTLGNSGIKNLRFTCPAAVECEGLNAITEGNYIYLPNTFSYPVDREEIRENIRRKSETLDRPLKISLFCEYRPMKNILTQVAAVAKVKEDSGRDIELHVFSAAYNSPIFTNMEKICEYKNIRLIVHERMSNVDCFKLQANMDLGLQVSLSETLSYVALEQMIQGVPVIGSDSIPFATMNASYSSMPEICDRIRRVIEDKEKYQAYCLDSLEKAERLNRNNISDALKAAERMAGIDA